MKDSPETAGRVGRWCMSNDTLPETNSEYTPENGGFQVRNLRISRGPLFSGAFAVSLREGMCLTWALAVYTAPY